jgi:hypothetical protein
MIAIRKMRNTDPHKAEIKETPKRCKDSSSAKRGRCRQAEGATIFQTGTTSQQKNPAHNAHSSPSPEILPKAAAKARHCLATSTVLNSPHE